VPAISARTRREAPLWLPPAALATITAAVVGVVLNLAVWFALHVLFAELTEVRWLGMKIEVPVLSSANIPSLILTLGAMLAVFRFKIGMIPVLLACSTLGILYYLRCDRYDLARGICEKLDRAFDGFPSIVAAGHEPSIETSLAQRSRGFASDVESINAESNDGLGL
jgi:hypothetical protein